MSETQRQFGIMALALAWIAGLGFGFACTYLPQAQRAAPSQIETNEPDLSALPDLPALPGDGSGGRIQAPFREYPIGETERNGMRVSAVWLPPVTMACGELPTGKHVIHLEADILALRKNPNGFGLGEWIPYLTVSYEISRDGEMIQKGVFHPMVARDGPHYGASIAMPGAAKYKLRYRIEPPSSNGFGRHTDEKTGVAEWWEAFAVDFEWNFQP